MLLGINQYTQYIYIYNFQYVNLKIITIKNRHEEDVTPKVVT